MQKINIDIVKLKRIFKEIPAILARRALLVFAFLVLLDLILGIFIFYQYSILSERKSVEIEDNPLILKEKTLQNVLNYMSQTQQRFQQTKIKEYPDIFNIR